MILGSTSLITVISILENGGTNRCKVLENIHTFSQEKFILANSLQEFFMALALL